MSWGGQQTSTSFVSILNFINNSTLAQIWWSRSTTISVICDESWIENYVNLTVFSNSSCSYYSIRSIIFGIFVSDRQILALSEPRRYQQHQQSLKEKMLNIESGGKRKKRLFGYRHFYHWSPCTDQVLKKHSDSKGIIHSIEMKNSNSISEYVRGIRFVNCNLVCFVYVERSRSDWLKNCIWARARSCQHWKTEERIFGPD